MITDYFYEGQLRSYLLQFCNIFAGLKVKTGKGECNEPEFMTVPITVGSRDRVVAALQAGNTQNKPFSLPIMAASISSISLSPNKKGIGVVDRRVFLPAGGVYPDDLRTVVRVMPIPYIMSVELSMYASNTQQLHQILEQILVLFDPALQIQTSDAAFDWTKITTVELTGINNEENYPPGGDRRVLMWSLTFDIPIYISAPVDIRDELVRKIIIQLGELDGFQINEFDENGELVPFKAGYDYGDFGKTIVTSRGPENT
jgi:hypothetical protein